MKKFISIAILFVLILTLFCGCSDTADDTIPAENQLPSRFVVVADKSFGYASAVQRENGGDAFTTNNELDRVMRYAVDRETRVVYIYINNTCSRYSGISLVPLYQADGSLTIYTGELPQPLYD